MKGEYQRRLIHFSGTLLPGAYVADLVAWRQIQYGLVVATVGVAVLEALRLLGNLEWWVFDRLTREYEQDNPAGYALAVVAAAIVVWAFPPVVAVPALLMLTVADPFAGLLGSTSSADVTKRASVVVATFVLCLAIGLVFLPPRGAVPAAALAVTADALKPRVFGFVIDDNFSIPVGAAVAGFLGVTYVPILVCEGSCLGIGLL